MFCRRMAKWAVHELTIWSEVHKLRRHTPAIALAPLLPLNPNLKILYLGSNNIGDEGAKALAETIPYCARLEFVSLRNNAEIGKEGKLALSAALEHPFTALGLRIDGADVRGKINLTKFRNQQGGKFSGKQKLDASRGGIAGGGLNRVGVGQLDDKGQFQKDAEALRVTHGEGLGEATQGRPSNKVRDQMELSHGMFTGTETSHWQFSKHGGSAIGVHAELRHLGI